MSCLRSHQEGSFIIDSPEWRQMQEALAPLLASREVSTFRGLLHTRREQTGLCYGPPVGLEVVRRRRQRQDRAGTETEWRPTQLLL